MTRTGSLNVPKARPYIGIYAKRPTGRLNVPKARPYMGKSRITLKKIPHNVDKKIPQTVDNPSLVCGIFCAVFLTF